MYKDTKSVTRIHNKLSPLYNTYSGLQQGALSSPILFNYFINDLIKELNQRTGGAEIRNLRITNLPFADDIVLTAKDKGTLQKLLDTCSNWANKWKLQFSQKKCKTLTTEKEDPSPMKLQNKQIGTVDKKTYKYLGLPMTKKGVDVTQYLPNIKSKMKAAVHALNTYCISNKINQKNRLTLYKAIIRSQLEYGIPVINYENNEIDRLDELQNRTLKQIIKLNNDTHKSTTYALTQLPSIRNRIHMMKINFYLKLQTPKRNSLSHMVYKQLCLGQHLRPKHKDRLPPTVEAIKILQQQNMQGYLMQKEITEYKETQQVAKKQIMHNQYKQTIKTHERQCISARQIPEEYKGHVPKIELPKRAVAEILDKFQRIKLNYENNYIPQAPIEPKLQLMNYLVQGDNNPRWYKPEECIKCRKCTEYYRLHRLLECRKYEKLRRNIMESISIELDYYAIKYGTQVHQIIRNELHSKLNDIARTGYVEKTDVHDIFSLITGGKISKNLKLKYSIPIQRMLLAHTVLLIQATQLGITKPEDTETVRIGELVIYKQDLRRGKIVVRTADEKNEQTGFTNIRHMIENMTLPELHNYEIGLGSATTRTSKQKLLARKYTNKVIQQASDHIIFTDGSIHFDNRNKPTQQGGCGGILINKSTGETLDQFCESMKTSDPQQAELHGILVAVQLANKLYKENKKNTTILCDCKNAVNYITNRYRTPWKYSNVYQEIKEEMILNNHKHITLKWIPGHTNNRYNDKADQLAKIATTYPLNPPVTRSLDGLSIRSFRPRLITD